jgi:hypothetical protein
MRYTLELFTAILFLTDEQVKYTNVALEQIYAEQFNKAARDKGAIRPEFSYARELSQTEIGQIFGEQLANAGYRVFELCGTAGKPKSES